MKKIMCFLSLFVGLCLFNVVKAETLDINLANNYESNYVFDMLVKDVKDSKVNVISGVITYDEDVFRAFDLSAQNGWEIQTVKDGNKVKFILVHMTDYAQENQKIIDIKTVVTGSSKEIKIALDNIVSSSSESAISVSDVSFKHEVVQTPVVSDKNDAEVPKEDITNNVEPEDKEETKTEEKEEKKEGKKDNSITARNIVSLIISFLVLGVVIAAGIFAHKENKKDTK